MKQTTKKWDRILFALLLAAGLLLFALPRMGQRSGSRIVVRVSGQEIASCSLREPQRIVIPGAKGGENLLVIDDGTAYMKNASCPDQLCVHQGRIHWQGESIVCLPNEVVVEIPRTTDENAPDLVTQ